MVHISTAFVYDYDYDCIFHDFGWHYEDFSLAQVIFRLANAIVVNVKVGTLPINCYALCSCIVFLFPFNYNHVLLFLNVSPIEATLLLLC